MITLNDYRLRLALRRALYRCSWHDSKVCINPNWHRQYWRYAGQGKFECEACERLNKWIRKAS